MKIRKFQYDIEFTHMLTFQDRYRYKITPFFNTSNLKYGIENIGTLEESIDKCMHLTIIHLDTLIELQDLIHDKKVPPHHLLDWYCKFVNGKHSFFDPPLSLSHFIKSEIYSKGFSYDSLPRFLRKEVPKVLEEF